MFWFETIRCFGSDAACDPHRIYVVWIWKFSRNVQVPQNCAEVQYPSKCTKLDSVTVIYWLVSFILHFCVDDFIINGTSDIFLPACFWHVPLLTPHALACSVHMWAIRDIFTTDTKTLYMKSSVVCDRDLDVYIIRCLSSASQTLSQSMRQADMNFEKLKTESERLEQHTKKSVNWLLWLMLILVSFTFISMILFIRIFPRLRWWTSASPELFSPTASCVYRAVTT